MNLFVEVWMRPTAQARSYHGVSDALHCVGGIHSNSAYVYTMFLVLLPEVNRGKEALIAHNINNAVFEKCIISILSIKSLTILFCFRFQSTEHSTCHAVTLLPERGRV
jgi:hypothetical protein